MTETKPTIAVLGGTGDLGAGLVMRLARAGYPMIVGSRKPEGAVAAAESLGGKAGVDSIRGLGNLDAAAGADIVILTVPYAHQTSTLTAVKDALQGKILVDVTVPLVPPKVRTVQLPPEGSAGKAAQILLGDGVRVVSAFQNVAADHLQDLEHAIDCDVLVCGNDPDARGEVMKLVAAAGMKGWQAGRIENAAVAEAMTSALIFMNNRYKIPGAGIRITGTPGKPDA